jgi:hypothetical protein
MTWDCGGNTSNPGESSEHGRGIQPRSGRWQCYVILLGGRLFKNDLLKGRHYWMHSLNYDVILLNSTEPDRTLKEQWAALQGCGR